jgi:hypothetical protein
LIENLAGWLEKNYKVGAYKDALYQDNWKDALTASQELV